MDSTATSGGTDQRSFPRNRNNNSNSNSNNNNNNNGRRNNRNGGGGGQAALKLENPMRVQKIPSTPEPRRDNNSDRSGNSRSPDRSPRSAATSGTADRNSNDAPRGNSKFGGENVKKPRKSFGDGRCYHLAFCLAESLRFSERRCTPT